jgi:hypothetical protein
MQFEIRTEAYRRIEQALVEAGIPFATNIPTVNVHTSPALPSAGAGLAEGQVKAAE